MSLFLLFFLHLLHFSQPSAILLLLRTFTKRGIPMQKATTTELKRTNTNNVLQFIYQQRKTSQQEIANNLQLSRPTISQILKELEALKLIEKNGFFESTGGRKADAITFVSSGKIALGLEILMDSYEIVAINLYGDIIKSQNILRHFTNDEPYYSEIGSAINEFVDSLHISSKRILGLGIVLQGLISFDGTKVTYGKILNCTGLTVDRFKQYIHYPCSIIHDAEAAATGELWSNPSIKDAVFFHIRSNLSGALIIDGKFLKGNELKSGVFEHMTIVPNGRPCYCGKRGCVETYCSLNALLPNGESIDAFFAELRKGAVEYRWRWNEYLKYLSTSINNLHMVIDYDIILGGVLARYLTTEDIDELHHLVEQKTAFPSKRRFIKISSCGSMPIAKGAALPYVYQYMDSVL